MTKQRRRLGLLSALMTGMSLCVVTAPPAGAAALSGVGWDASKPNPSQTGVRYTWMFTTATTATLSRVDLGVLTTTAGTTLTVTDVYGLPAGGTATLSGTTVSYTLATPTSVSAGVKVLIAIDGFTNPTARSGSSTVTTYNNAAPAVAVDTAASNSINFDDNTIVATVVIARSTTFTDSISSFRLLLDPSVASTSDVTAAGTLTVKSNGANGYALDVQATTLAGTSGATVANATSGVATGVGTASFPSDRRGYTMTRSAGIGTLQGQLATAGNYVGYTAAGEDAVAATGPTNNDQFTITHRVKIDYGQAAGTYTSTITYTVTPSY